MAKHTHQHHWPARLFGAVALLGAAAAGLGALSPGGLGRPGPVEVTGGASVSAYRSLTEAVHDAPGWLGHLLELGSEATLVVLGLLLLGVCWSALRRRDAGAVAGVALIGSGTVVAYAVSEALKLVVDEERPCRAVDGAEAVAACPEPGDWSFPSNHATLAAALAVGPAVRRPRLAAVTLPVAVAAALLRVLVGVHYPHDVAAGALLGGAVAASALLVLGRPAGLLVSALLGRWWGQEAGFVGDDGGRGPVADAEAGQDGADVRLDRAFDQVQPPGDLPVGQSAAEVRQHVALPGRQFGDPLPGGVPPAGPFPGSGGREVRDHPGGDLR